MLPAGSVKEKKEYLESLKSMAAVDKFLADVKGSFIATHAAGSALFIPSGYIVCAKTLEDVDILRWGIYNKDLEQVGPVSDTLSDFLATYPTMHETLYGTFQSYLQSSGRGFVA